MVHRWQQLKKAVPRRHARAIRFRDAIHEPVPKVLMGRRFTRGKGIDQDEAVLRDLATHRSTANFLATKASASFFVSGTPAPELLVRRKWPRRILTQAANSQRFFTKSCLAERRGHNPFAKYKKHHTSLLYRTLRAFHHAPDKRRFDASLLVRST